MSRREIYWHSRNCITYPVNDHLTFHSKGGWLTVAHYRSKMEGFWVCGEAENETKGKVSRLRRKGERQKKKSFHETLWKMLGNVSIKIIHQKISFSFHGKSLVARGCGWQKTHHWRSYWIRNDDGYTMHALLSSPFFVFAKILCNFSMHLRPLDCKAQVWCIEKKSLNFLSSMLSPLYRFFFLEEFKWNQLIIAWIAIRIFGLLINLCSIINHWIIS